MPGHRWHFGDRHGTCPDCQLPRARTFQRLQQNLDSVFITSSSWWWGRPRSCHASCKDSGVRGPRQKGGGMDQTPQRSLSASLWEKAGARVTKTGSGRSIYVFFERWREAQAPNPEAWASSPTCGKKCWQRASHAGRRPQVTSRCLHRRGWSMIPGSCSKVGPIIHPPSI